jgi:hypothetical protein
MMVWLSGDPLGSHLRQIVDGALSNGASGYGVQERWTVELGQHALIEDHHHPAVSLAPDEATKPLAKTQHRLWYRKLVEGVFKGLAARREDGIVRDREG